MTLVLNLSEAGTEFLAGAGSEGLVSIVVPTSSRAYIVANAIESALDQTHENVEVIVVDVGSTDRPIRLSQAASV